MEDIDRRANEYSHEEMAKPNIGLDGIRQMIAAAYADGARSNVHELNDPEGVSNTESKHQIYGYRLGYKKAMANAWHWINAQGSYDALKDKFEEYMEHDKI